MIQINIIKPVKIAIGTTTVLITTKIEIIPIAALQGGMAVIYLN